MMRIHSPPSLPSLLLLLLAVPLCTSTDPRPPRGTLIWPKPQRHDIAAGSAKGRAEAHGFAFNATGAESAILTAAFRRYRGLCFPSAAAHGSSAAVSASAIPALVALDVNVSSSELGLGLSTSEIYTLTISFPRSSLVATTVFGALRGLETFSQLLQDDGTISAQTVTDWPRFPFRAVMIDSSRHYLPVSLIRAHIDAMTYNKMNVLHWHIVDSNSFPYVSTAFPNLSTMGAYSASHIYSPSDIAALVQYATYRGVRIIPEFDSPSHVMPSWGKGGPSELLTTCGKSLGPLRADREQTYTFLSKLLREVGQVFPDETFHAGGDEVSFGCWGANPDVKRWIAERNMTLTDLNNYYMQRLFGIVTASGRQQHGRRQEEQEPGMGKKDVMVWRPGAADHGVTPPKGVIFDVYSGIEQCPPDGQGCYNITASKTTADGHRVVRSAGYYLDQLCDLDPDHSHHGNYWGYFSGWKFYARDPVEGMMIKELGARPELVIGGKANMWGEHVDAANFLPRVWPRTSVIAERLWSSANVTDIGEATPRLHEFRCRSLVARGIAASPIGAGHDGTYHPGYCAHELPFVYTPPGGGAL